MRFENRKRDQCGTVEGYENAYLDDLTDRTASARTNLLICSLSTVNSDQNPVHRTPMVSHCSKSALSHVTASLYFI